MLKNKEPLCKELVAEDRIQGVVDQDTRCVQRCAEGHAVEYDDCLSRILASAKGGRYGDLRSEPAVFIKLNFGDTWLEGSLPDHCAYFNRELGVDLSVSASMSQKHVDNWEGRA